MLDKLAQIRKDAYLDYLAFSYKLREDRNLFTEDKEKLRADAYKKYKKIEEKTEELELEFELEKLYRDRPVDVQI